MTTDKNSGKSSRSFRIFSLYGLNKSCEKSIPCLTSFYISVIAKFISDSYVNRMFTVNVDDILKFFLYNLNLSSSSNRFLGYHIIEPFCVNYEILI